MRQVVITFWYLLVIIDTTAFAVDDYSATHESMRDPIVNFALRIFPIWKILEMIIINILQKPWRKITL